MTAPLRAVADDGPLGAATTALVDWLRETTGDEVRIAPPGPADDTRAGLDVWPLELRAEPELRTSNRLEPLRLRVRHVVAGHTAALGKALTAATAAGRPMVDLTPLPAQSWLALGGTPRPALLFDMPAVIVRPQPERPLVTEELRLSVTPKTQQILKEA